MPWGLRPGNWSLYLFDRTKGGGNVLWNALTVTEGLGKWTNIGPFGGQVNDLVFQPGTPNRLYAAVHNAGLFLSTDGGANWNTLINDSFPMRIQVSPADPQALYLNTNNGIRRSLDGGVSWISINPDQTTPGGTLAAFPHPSEPGTVFIAASPNMNNYNAGGLGQLWKSTDHGDTFQPLANAGLTDKRITELTFDPSDATHQTMLAGTIAGKVFVTSDGGATWLQKADLAAAGDRSRAHHRLVYNPAGGEPWAVKRNPFLPTDWPVYYRSSSDLSTGPG